VKVLIGLQQKSKQNSDRVLRRKRPTPHVGPTWRTRVRNTTANRQLKFTQEMGTPNWWK